MASFMTSLVQRCCSKREKYAAHLWVLAYRGGRERECVVAIHMSRRGRRPVRLVAKAVCPTDKTLALGDLFANPEPPANMHRSFRALLHPVQTRYPPTCRAPLPKCLPEEETTIGMGPGPSGKRYTGEAAGNSGDTSSHSAHGDSNRPIHGACTGRRQYDAAVARGSTLQDSRDCINSRLRATL